MAGFEDLVTVVPIKDVDGLLARPELIVAGLDDEDGLAVLLGEAMAHFPHTGVVRIDASGERPEAARRFGQGTGRLLLLKQGIVLKVLRPGKATLDELEGLLAWAGPLEAAAELRKADAWLGEAPPADDSEFRRGVCGVYGQPDEYTTIRLTLDFKSRCEHRRESGGFAGMSSSAMTGGWVRRGDHLLELCWRGEEDDEEVGWSRHRSERAMDYREWIRVAWKGGVVTEVRFASGIVPSLEPEERRYLRQG